MRRLGAAAGFPPSASRLGRVLLVLGLGSALAAACGGNPEYVSPGQQTGGDDALGKPGGAGPGASEGGAGFELGLGGASSTPQGGVGATDLALVVTAEQTELEVSGEPVTVQLSARFEDGSKPNTVVWSVD